MSFQVHPDLLGELNDPAASVASQPVHVTENPEFTFLAPKEAFSYNSRARSIEDHGEHNAVGLN